MICLVFSVEISNLNLMSDNNQKKLNPVSLAINVILIIAVVILYIFHFAGDDAKDAKKQTQPQNTMPAMTSTGPAKIAFVNSDLLLQDYDLVAKLSKQLEKESKKKDADLNSRQKELETEAAYFQESMQNKSLNEQSAQKIYDQLMVKQQEIYQLQEQYAAELGQKEFEMNIILLDSVRNFLSRLNVNNKYDYILNYNATGSILSATDNFDITNIVLEGLNKEYNDKYAPENK